MPALAAAQRLKATAATMCGRSSPQKERDIETGLDYFGARYYASTQGRFTSADPLYLEMKRLPDPQRLNLYQYARNNPLKFLDPNGLDVTLEGIEQDEYRTGLNARKGAAFQVGVNKNNQVVIVDKDGNELSKKALNGLAKTLSGGEKELFNAITDQNRHVTIDTGDGTRNSGVFFGRFDGNGHQTLDFSDIKQLDAPGNSSGPNFSNSDVLTHETLEAYYGTMPSSADVNSAHQATNPFFPGLDPIPNSGFARPTCIVCGTLISSATTDWQVHGNSAIKMRITTEYISPVPAASLPQPVHVIKVEKLP
ncbi:MAG: RHS repeat-associated core domain-containing protein [Pyrinomonadaceae bacterium]